MQTDGVNDLFAFVDRVQEGDTLEALSARLGVPACMLLRINHLFSPAWLLPGREIRVPDPSYCVRGADDFPCPVEAVKTPARPI